MSVLAFIFNEVFKNFFFLKGSKFVHLTCNLF